MNRGWQRYVYDGPWYPMEEPFPRPIGSPGRENIKLTLDRVYFHIYWTITAGDITISQCIDDLDDNPVLWIEFANILSTGGYPHAALCSDGPTQFEVHEVEQQGMCRLIVKYRGREPKLIDIVVSRDELISQFVEFFNSIADNPCFGHSFMFSGIVPDDAYEAVEKVAAAEWKTGVEEGKFPDDYDAEVDYIERRIATEIPLPHYYQEIVDRYKVMLRTRIIPEDWRRAT